MLSSEELGHELIILHVGPDRKKLSVHKKLLCARAAFLDKAFNGLFLESAGVMELPEDDECAINRFISWVYGGSIPAFEFKIKDREEAHASILIASHILPLVSLANRLCINEFTNQVVDVIQDWLLKERWTFAPQDVPRIYEITSAESPFRLLCAGAVALRLKFQPNVLEEYTGIELEHPEFFKHIVAFQNKHWRQLYVKDADPRIHVRSGLGIFADVRGLGNQCLFHTHAEGEICHLEKLTEPSNAD